jgi:hypothetical protein
MFRLRVMKKLSLVTIGSDDDSWPDIRELLLRSGFAEEARENLTREQVAERLHPLLDLPVELVLATHGGPADRAALERAFLTPRQPSERAAFVRKG